MGRQMAKILWIDDYAGSMTGTLVGFDGLVYFIRRDGHTIQSVPHDLGFTESIARASTYDLILLDLVFQMPGQSSLYGGLDYLRKLEADKVLTPVVILSIVPVGIVRELMRSTRVSGTTVVSVLQKGGIRPSHLASAVFSIIRDSGGE